MITNEVYFFKNQSSVSTSDSLYNVNDGTLILQVDGNVSNLELLVLGNTDLVDDDFVTLKTINASDYSMSDKITSTGIYWIDINGIRKIKLNLSKITGSVNVRAITKRGLTTDLIARAMAANSSGGGSYTLPVASAETLGGIKVGENLEIKDDGTLNNSIPVSVDANRNNTVLGNGNTNYQTGRQVTVFGKSNNAKDGVCTTLYGVNNTGDRFCNIVGYDNISNGMYNILIGNSQMCSGNSNILLGNNITTNESNIAQFGSDNGVINKVYIYTKDGLKTVATLDDINNAIASALENMTKE